MGLTKIADKHEDKHKKCFFPIRQIWKYFYHDLYLCIFITIYLSRKFSARFSLSIRPYFHSFSQACNTTKDHEGRGRKNIPWINLNLSIACEQALNMKWEPASMTNQFEYLPRNVRFSKYGMSIPIWCCLYTVFQNIRYSSKNLNVLNAVFSKQNISCFKIRWPRPIWSIDVFFMHSASASQTTCKSAFLLVLHDVLNVHTCPPPHPDSKRHVRPIKCTLTNALIFSGKSLRRSGHYGPAYTIPHCIGATRFLYRIELLFTLQVIWKVIRYMPKQCKQGNPVRSGTKSVLACMF